MDGESAKGELDEAITIAYDGVLKMRTGDFEGAVKDFKKSLQIVGESHSQATTLFKNLGIAYYRQKKYKEALKYQNKLLARVGEDHDDSGPIYFDIGNIYRSMQKPTKACTNYEKCLSSASTPSQTKAAAYNNMGMVYLNLAKSRRNDSETHKMFKKAADLFQNSIDLHVKRVGNDHDILVADTYNNIATAYILQGLHVEAIEYLKKCYQINLKLRPQDPKTIGAKEALKAVRSISTEELENLKLTGGVSEPRLFDNTTCSGCLKKGLSGLKCCSRCKSVFYCSSSCQKRDWEAFHKKECKKLRKDKKKNKKFEVVHNKMINDAKKKMEQNYAFGKIFPAVDPSVALTGDLLTAYNLTCLGSDPLGSKLMDNIPPITFEVPQMLGTSANYIYLEGATLVPYGNPFLTVHKKMKFVAELCKIPRDAGSVYDQACGQHGGIFLRINEKYMDDDAKYKFARPQAFQLYIIGEAVFTPACFDALKAFYHDDGGCRGADFEWPDHRATFVCPVTRRIAIPDGKTPYIFCYQPLSAIYNKDGVENASCRTMPRLLSMEGYKLMMNKRNNCVSKVKIPSHDNLNRELECFPDAQNFLEKTTQSWIVQPKTKVDFQNFCDNRQKKSTRELNLNDVAEVEQLKQEYYAMVKERGLSDETLIPTVGGLFNLMEASDGRFWLERFTSASFSNTYKKVATAYSKHAERKIEFRKNIPNKNNSNHSDPLTPIISGNAKCICGSKLKYKKCCGAKSIRLHKKRAKEKNFPIGLEVTFCQLKTGSLNGVFGTVVKEYDEKTGRVACERQDNGKLLALKPENLVPKYIHNPEKKR